VDGVEKMDEWMNGWEGGFFLFTFDRKSIPMVAWYMLSKESYMNLVISEVLPTMHVTPT